MKATNLPHRPKRATLAAAFLALIASTAYAEIRLSRDWERSPSCIGGPKTAGELAAVQQGRRSPGVCPPDEVEKLDAAVKRLASSLNAVPPGDVGQARFDLGFQLHLNDLLFYVKPAMFMAVDKPGEVCTPVYLNGPPQYMCREGQRHTNSCHLLFLTKDFEPAGVLRLRIDEPYRYYCNAMPALGTGDKSRNELLVTMQYFAIDDKAASKAGDIGSGWKRMTVLVRVKEVNGKIVAEQDDSCLHNPNSIDTVPDARKALNRCRSGGN